MMCFSCFFCWVFLELLKSCSFLQIWKILAIISSNILFCFFFCSRTKSTHVKLYNIDPRIIEALIFVEIFLCFSFCQFLLCLQVLQSFLLQCIISYHSIVFIFRGFIWVFFISFTSVLIISMLFSTFLNNGKLKKYICFILLCNFII